MPPATGGNLVSSRTQTQEDLRRTLTFAERVAYQYAIEEVYWRHRIWPRGGGENPAPKPPLDAIVSQGQVEQKVEDYLRKSELIANERGSAITVFELQTEMDRMASKTRQSETLRELFAALGNDPYLIAECLVRPILTECLVREFKGGSSPEAASGRNDNPKREAITNSRPSARATTADGAPKAFASRQADPSKTAYKLPEISAPFHCTGDDAWAVTTTVNAPDAREFHTAVWTGIEMIIWGGYNFPPGDFEHRRQIQSQHAIAGPPRAPPAPHIGRVFQTAVWTGSEMIVWGGYTNGIDLDDGGRYNPSTDSWMATSATNAPARREQSHGGVDRQRDDRLGWGRMWQVTAF